MSFDVDALVKRVCCEDVSGHARSPRARLGLHKPFPHSPRVLLEQHTAEPGELGRAVLERPEDASEDEGQMIGDRNACDEHAFDPTLFRRPGRGTRADDVRLHICETPSAPDPEVAR